METYKKDLPPTLHVYGYCPVEDEVYHGLAPILADRETVRNMLPLFYVEIARDMKCDCGKELIPIGYSFHSCAWMLKVPEGKQDELRAWFSARLEIKDHPKRRNCYVAAMKTSIGRECIIVYELNEDYAVSETVEGADKFTGAMAFDLPQIRLKEWVKVWKGSARSAS
jgi:hypothetical protein